MYYRKLPNTIINTRPLVFLCGPYIEENNPKDRRNILRKNLGNLKRNIAYEDKNFTIRPLALIVDKLFEGIGDEEQEKINIALFEEIVAACSYKNYIFVDTMSTVLELGLFSNSYADNKTTAFLPSDYELFKPTIGFFVEETMKKSQNIQMCRYKNSRYNKIISEENQKRVIENLVGFRKNIVPKNIEKEIDKDFVHSYEAYTIYIDFTRDFREKDKIYFEYNYKELIFNVPIKILLYLVQKYSEAERIKDILLEYFYQYSCRNNERLGFIYYMAKIKKVKFIVHSPFAYNFKDVVLNMQYLINAIKDRSQEGRYSQKFYNLEYKELDYSLYKNSKVKFHEVLGFGSKDVGGLEKLLNKQKKALTTKFLYINGKKRTIDMYKGTSEGYKLREVHTHISEVLNRLIEINDSSYAYRKEVSIKDCVNNHVGNKYFLKIDIHKFFESIRKVSMNKILKMNLSSDIENSYDQNLKGKSYNYKSKTIDSWEGIYDILNLCFVKGRMPLGLVTSPVLANIYMNEFDYRIVKEFPNLTYSRYSDDILISSENPFVKEEIISFVEQELSLLGLTMNYKKTRYMKLQDVGDHVKFIGLNIIKGEDKNYISVGKHYIKNVCQDTTGYLRNNKNTLEKEQIIGEIEYIKFISKDDYEYFLKLFKIKTGNEFNYDSFKKCSI